MQVLEPVPIILYKNGLAMFSGPFRPYSDPATQQVIRDLTEGYFPSELQSRFPEGVSLAVTDQRDVLLKVNILLRMWTFTRRREGSIKVAPC